MEFETEKICLNQIVDSKEERFSAEDNIIIPDIKPDILSTVSTSGNIYVYKKEITNGKLRIDGGIQVCLIYMSDGENNEVRGLNATIDFSKSIELDKVENEYDVCCYLSLEDISCKILNGRKININANIMAKVNVFSNEEVGIVNSVNDLRDIQVISSSMQANCLKGKGETISIAKDSVTTESAISDILDTNISVRNKDIKVSYNKVLSKADVVVEILYLSCDGSINNVTLGIPIMGFIDMNGITENDICNTQYEVRNINVRPNNIDDNVINVEIEYVICCRAYEIKEINLIQDMYSPEEEIDISQKRVGLIKNKNIVNDSCNIQGIISVPEIKDGTVYMTRMIPSIIKEEKLNGVLKYEGEVRADILYESSSTNSLEVRSETISFTHEINSSIFSKNSITETKLSVNSKDFECTPDNRVNINANLDFCIDVYEKDNVNIVSDVKVTPIENNDVRSSIVVYYVKEGDTLWKIAKKFRSTVDEIASVNNIENVNKLKIGEQLFIPKYACNRIS